MNDPSPHSYLLMRAMESAARRLQHVCADWPEERFADLVQSAALTQLKSQTSPRLFELLRHELDAQRDTLLVRIRERAD